MRKNVARVIDAFNKGERLNLETISTDGTSIFSYSTCLIEKCPSITTPITVLIVNDTKYSVTTTRQQNSLEYGLIPSDDPNYWILRVKNIPIGAQSLTSYVNWSEALS